MAPPRDALGETVSARVCIAAIAFLALLALSPGCLSSASLGGAPSPRVTSGWQAPQVLGRLAAWMREAGLEEGRTSCQPWQLAQLATSTSPDRRARPW